MTDDPLLVYSAKRLRLYKRKYDHDEMRACFKAGASIADLAERYGVTETAIYYALDDNYRARMHANSRRFMLSGVCELCGAATMPREERIKRARKRGAEHSGRVLCPSCIGKTRRTSVRLAADGSVAAIRCVTEHCAHGERWQPPENFPLGSRFKDLREGGFHNCCRACNTAYRRALRERSKVPCVNCGRPCLAASDRGGKPQHRHNTGLCKQCYFKRKKGLDAGVDHHS